MILLIVIIEDQNFVNNLVQAIFQFIFNSNKTASETEKNHNKLQKTNDYLELVHNLIFLIPL